MSAVREKRDCIGAGTCVCEPNNASDGSPCCLGPMKCCDYGKGASRN